MLGCNTRTLTGVKMGKFTLPLMLAMLCSFSYSAAAQDSSSQAAAPSSEAELPIFDFLGQNTETPSTMKALNGVPCKTSKDGHRSCTAFNRPKIGGVSMNFIGMSFYNDKLHTAFGMAESISFYDLLSAFTAKYGKPEMQTRKWQNRAGASLDNTVAVWRFRGGKLELASLGQQIDKTDFMFISFANAPAPRAPKVDF